MTHKEAAIEPAPVRIALDPEDWFWANWRTLEPLPQPPVRPFDLEALLTKLAGFSEDYYGWKFWRWGEGYLDCPVSPEESTFWFTAMAEQVAGPYLTGTLPKLIAEKLRAQPPSGPITPALVKKAVSETERLNGPSLRFLLGQFSPLQTIAFLVESEEALYTEEALWKSGFYHKPPWRLLGGTHEITEGFRRWVRPYLPPAELQEIQGYLRFHLSLAPWPNGPNTDRTTPPEGLRLVFPLAAVFGLSGELRPLVEDLEDDYYWRSPDRGGYAERRNPLVRNQYWHNPTRLCRHHPQDVIFGLGSAEEVQTQMRRLQIPLAEAADVRCWLAHTELSALDYVKDMILYYVSKWTAPEFFGVLSLVHAPEAAPVMLDLMVSSGVTRPARQWLETHTAHAVTGLLPLAGGDGPLAEPATEFLRGLRRHGQAALIEAGLAALPPDAAARVRSGVLAGDDPVPFDDITTPPWLRDALAGKAVKAKGGWVQPIDLPEVTFGADGLNDAQTGALLRALAAQKATNPVLPSLVAAVKAYADPASLDRFAWQLFQRWRTEGEPPAGRWALRAVGHLGGDVLAQKLGTLVQAEPGEKPHSLAALSLEVLRAMGTDMALRQISELAQNVPARVLRRKANACMEKIALNRNLSRAELEEQIELKETQ